MYVDLTRAQVQRLIDGYAVYLLDSGRMSVAGLTRDNVDYVVDSLIGVIEA